MLVSSWGLFRNHKSGQHVRVFKTPQYASAGRAINILHAAKNEALLKVWKFKVINE